MPVIIDGYNLIFAMGWEGKSVSGRSLERARRRLLKTLAEGLPESERVETTIVFDAVRLPIRETYAEQTLNGMRVLFAVDQPDADTLIEQLIRQHPTPKKLTVVSSDHRLHKAARRRRANAIDSDVWLDRLLKNNRAAADDAAATSADLRQVAMDGLRSIDWEKEFGLKDFDRDQQSGTARDDVTTFDPFPPGYGEDLLDP